VREWYRDSYKHACVPVMQSCAVRLHVCLSICIYVCLSSLSLHKVLKSGTKLEFRAERDEECEDDEGNVYTKKTFEDLAKQGIIKPAVGLTK
jgi:hypothetical protein